MDTKRMLFVVIAGVVVTSLGACATTDKSTAINYAARQFDGADRVALMKAGVESMEAVGFRVGRYEPDDARVVSDPLFDVQDDPRAARPRLSTTSRKRRIAEVRVASPADQLRLYCRVLVQEQTTQAHRMMALDRSGGDVPSSTPIDREAASTNEQNTVWKTIRRDRIAERRILGLVEESMQGS